MVSDIDKLQSTIYSTTMDSWSTSITRLLNAAKLSEQITGKNTILIKPNLVEAIDPPVTTPVSLVENLIIFLRKIFPNGEILIGEGTGSIDYETSHCFEALGYTEMAARLNTELLDLNTMQLVHLKRQVCKRWPEIYLPDLLDQVFLISVPVLKAHSLAKVTLTMKNMMGCAPPSHYQQGGSWGKSAFHNRIHEAIFDLNRYRSPDFTLLDATIGMSQAHLWGPHCDPPVGLLAASYDPVAIDSYGCKLLSRNWRSVGHINMAHEVLGFAEPLEVQEV